MSDQLDDRLLQFVRTEVASDGTDLTLETDLLLTGLVDSLGVIRITQWLEDEYGLTVDPADVTLENFQTIGRMVAYAAAQGASA